jgi:hypothetical protein
VRIGSLKYRNTKHKGDAAEAAVLAALVKNGYNVLVPFGDNLRYDLCVDLDGKIIRIQVKTGRLQDGCIVFSACSSQAHRGKGSRSYKGGIELFGVWYPEDDSVYFVSPEDIGSKQGSLRVFVPKNGQKKKIRWAKDYAFPLNPLPLDNLGD